MKGEEREVEGALGVKISKKSDDIGCKSSVMEIEPGCRDGEGDSIPKLDVASLSSVCDVTG